MPKMNGIDATAVIRDLYPEINVIGLSVQASEDMQQAMLKAGASALLTKEAAVDQLYQTIQAVQVRQTTLTRRRRALSAELLEQSFDRSYPTRATERSTARAIVP